MVAPISDSPKPPPQRITLTLPVLNAARLVSTARSPASCPGAKPPRQAVFIAKPPRQAVFIATGASKAPALKQAFAPETELPAGLVLAYRTVWLVDQPAAAEIAEQQKAAEHLYG